jgi:soluble lytic murein transglycosylase
MPLTIRRRAFIVAVIAMAVGSAAAGAAGAPAEQRRLFLDAHNRIAQGERVDVQAERERLGDYVLAPYLDYYALQRRLAQASPAQVATFLRDNPELPVAGLLRDAYLHQLGRRGRWKDFAALYTPSASAELQCYDLRARRALKDVDAAWLEQARALWLVGRSQPNACDPVFEELYARDAISADQVWERVTLLFDAGEHRLAEFFMARLDPARRDWLQYWLMAHRRPRQVLDRPPFPLIGPYAAQVIAHAIQRDAHEDPERAMADLERYGRGQLLSVTQKAYIARAIALQTAYSQDPRALAWLDALPPGAVTDHVRLWTARMALRSQNWSRLIQAVDALPERDRRDPQWRYWRAHAQSALDQQQASREAFAMLAQERNYYGFLAADRLGMPYNLNHVPTRVPPDALAATAGEPGIARALEFYRLGMTTEARREWHHALAQLDRVRQQYAAVLALQAGWYDRAVITANQAGLDDDLDLRFPTPFRERVEHYSKLSRLQPSVTYAILRKESAFRPDAVSPVGALGLMQVMPETGKRVAKDLRLKPPSRAGLLDIDTNLKLGSAYLRAMLDRYNGNLVLAAAAYNAGPHRVTDWLDRNAGLSPALWIEAISFYETREYVKSVLAFAAVFDWQLNGTPSRLSEYLLPFTQQGACADEQNGSCQPSVM